MSLSFLSDQLSNLGPATKENRDRVANIVLETPPLFTDLVFLTFQIEDKLSIKAAWIHPELKHLISTKIIHESKGCETRGKYVLKAIEKHKNSTR